MRIEGWCKQAQVDQFGLSGAGPTVDSHLYSNHGYSRQKGLINERCLTRIQEELSDLEFDGPIGPNGAAATLVERAGLRQHQKALGVRAKADDLRLMGPPVRIDETTIFARVDRVRRAPRSVTGSGYGPHTGTWPAAPGTGEVIAGALRVPSAVRVVWITLLSEMIAGVRQLRPASKDELLLAVYKKLGLKPREIASIERKCIRLFRVKPAQTVHRPHAWSEGYADRFSSYSPRADGLGSAVDVERAMPGLPEAVTRDSDLDEIPPGAPEYEAMCDELAAINPRLVQLRDSDEGYIAGDVESAQAQPAGGYAWLKASIVRFLTFDRRCEPLNCQCERV